MKIAVILGTRPEIIKMSPIIREFKKRRLNFFILHTNQHYSENLDRVFFKELNIISPKYNLNICSGTHSQVISKIIMGVDSVLLKEKPDVVVVQGDTNTVLAGSLAAAKLNIKIAHIEAGLRSYFSGMPEELNRILTDHCSEILFAPTHLAKDNLLKEGIDKNKIFISGNTIVDAVLENIKIANEKSKILDDLRLEKNKYFLLTIHRQENVDDKTRIMNIFKGIELVQKKFNTQIICPIHPRTKKMMDQFGVKVGKKIKLIEPLGYFDFLQLEKNSRLIFTDSGGVQEEACILHVPCVTLRDNTERPETLMVKSNILSGVDPNKILKCAVYMVKKNSWNNPFGNGKSSSKIVDLIWKKIN